MKLMLIQKISFKDFIDNSSNSNNSNSSNSSISSISNSNNNNSHIKLKNRIIKSFGISKKSINNSKSGSDDDDDHNKTTSTSNTSTINTNIINTNTINEDEQWKQNQLLKLENKLYSLNIHYRESYSKTQNNQIKIISIPFKDINININFKERDLSTSISFILLFLIIITERDCKEYIESRFEGTISFLYLLNKLDKEDYLNVIHLMGELIEGFPIYGINNTNIKISINSRLYENDLGLTLNLDIDVSEYIPIEKTNIKYFNLQKYINQQYTINSNMNSNKQPIGKKRKFSNYTNC